MAGGRWQSSTCSLGNAPDRDICRRSCVYKAAMHTRCTRDRHRHMPPEPCILEYKAAMHTRPAHETGTVGIQRVLLLMGAASELTLPGAVAAVIELDAMEPGILQLLGVCGVDRFLPRRVSRVRKLIAADAVDLVPPHEHPVCIPIPHETAEIRERAGVD